MVELELGKKMTRHNEDEANTNKNNENGRNEQEERYRELEKLIGVQESRIQNLQSSAFQLANYYFVFQGVVLAAISNTASLTCTDSWFIFSLSLFAATLNLFALFSIATKYVRAMNIHEQTWAEYNAVAGAMNRAESLEFTGEFRQWRDHFSRRRRYVFLAVCMALFVAFTAVTLAGPWRVTCKHDRSKKKNHSYSGSGSDCLKLCDNSSRCMFFCQEMQ